MFKTLADTLTPGQESLTITNDLASTTVPSLEQVGVEMLMLEDDLASLESLGSQLENLQHLESIGSQSGMESLIAFASKADLLGSAALSYSSDAAALEGIDDAIKNTLANFASKAAETAKKIAGGVSNFVSSAWQAVSGTVSKIASGVYNKAKAAAAHVKAHKAAYATAALATIAAAAAAAIAIWGVPASLDATGWVTKVKNIVEKIKFGKAAVIVNADGSIDVPFTVVADTPKEAGNLLQLGYDQAACNALATETTQTIGKTGKLAAFAKQILDAIMKALGVIKNAKGEAAAFARKAFWNSLKATMKLVRFIMKLFSSTVKPALGTAVVAYAGA